MSTHNKPGTALAQIFRHLGITPEPGCRCLRLARLMDDIGVDGCMDSMTLDYLVKELKFNRQIMGWRVTWKIPKILLFLLVRGYNPLKPYRSFVVMACRLTMREPVTLDPPNEKTPQNRSEGL